MLDDSSCFSFCCCIFITRFVRELLSCCYLCVIECACSFVSGAFRQAHIHIDVHLSTHTITIYTPTSPPAPAVVAAAADAAAASSAGTGDDAASAAAAAFSAAAALNFAALLAPGSLKLRKASNSSTILGGHRLIVRTQSSFRYLPLECMVEGRRRIWRRRDNEKMEWN